MLDKYILQECFHQCISIYHAKNDLNNSVVFSNIQKTFQHMVSGDTNPTGIRSVIIVVAVTLLGEE